MATDDGYRRTRYNTIGLVLGLFIMAGAVVTWAAINKEIEHWNRVKGLNDKAR